MIVYLARVIPAFVMYCVIEESGSSLLIESTDSMIMKSTEVHNTQRLKILYIYVHVNLDS